MRNITEWDKFNESKEFCRKLGCKLWNIEVCCPELMRVLCEPKKRLLNKFKIHEIDLDNNKVSYDEIRNRLRERGV